MADKKNSKCKRTKQKANIKQEIKEDYKTGIKYYEEIEKTHEDV